MTSYVQNRTAAVAALVAIAMVAAVALVGAGALLAGTQAATANHDSPGDYEVVLPDEDDHLPGDQNPGGASVQHFAGLDGGLEDVDAEEYEVLEWLVISSDEVDFGECQTQDTGGFGIDRGSNNDGTEYDDDLLEHRKDSAFLDTMIWVEFYTEEDFGGDTIGITENDAIVAYQTDCYTMPEEPGWYQIDGKVNGTTPDGEFMETSLTSHYFPICEGCHDEDTAEDELGPPPSQQDDGTESTPTPTETETSDDTDDTEESTPTATPEGSDDAGEADDTDDTESDDGADDTGESTDDDGADDEEAATATESDDDATGGADDGAGSAGEGTPTPGDGPGFTGLAAVLALLSGSLLVRRLE